LEKNNLIYVGAQLMNIMAKLEVLRSIALSSADSMKSSSA